MVSKWMAIFVLATACRAPEDLEALEGHVAEVVTVASIGEVAEVEAPPTPRAIRELPPFVQPEIGPRPKDAYGQIRHDLEVARRDLYLRHLGGESVTDEARATLAWHLPALMKAWVGTRYSYSGTSQTPRRGKIACGYYVSTVLQHAGFTVDRVDLARQASEQIIRTLSPDPIIERFRWWSPSRVVSRVVSAGEGLYIVGLDTHVGFLVASGDQVTFCHSTSRKERRKRVGVVCETARTSPSLKSRYTVLGRLDDPALVEAWLAGAALPTARKGQTTALAPLAWDGIADLGPADQLLH